MSLSKILRTKFHNLADLPSLDEKSFSRITQISPIVSLTTVPNRIINIKPTIASLLRQRLAPREIHLNIGKDYFGDAEVPDFLNGLKTLKVFMEDIDRGPATKYLYTLRRVDPDDLVIILDDDMYYPNTLIEDLVRADSEYNHQCAICINGLRVPKSLCSFDRELDREIKLGHKRVAVIEGCGGYALRPSYFKTDLFDLTGSPLRAFFDDDFWISGHLSRNNIEKYQITGRKRRRALSNTIESAIGGDREELQSELMRYFSDDWKEEEIV